MTAYEQLKQKWTELSYLGKGTAILGWDSDVMMPPYASDDRGKIMATLSAIAHQKSSDPALAELIDQAQGEVSTSEDKRNLSMIQRDYLLSSQVPSTLVYALAEATNAATRIWEQSKADSNWPAVQPALQTLFSLAKEQAEIHGELLGCSAYDAQLSHGSIGNSEAVIDPLFALLKQELPELVQKIVEKQKSIIHQNYELPIDKQKIIAVKLAEQLGYDFNRGRLDVTAHPASYGTKYDSRITARYLQEDPFTGLLCVGHEAGHALYTQNLPNEWETQPLGSDRDMSIHESQSLILEKNAILSNEFMPYLYGMITDECPEFSLNCSAEQFANSLHQVKPSYIRFEADEATYPLHVILRYEIEKKLFSSKADVKDIPELWNTGFKEMLGLDVPQHNLGCMQDIHWYCGLYGYFPVYTQGALYASQLFAAMKKDVLTIDDDLKQGNFSNFNRWLNQNIHQHGQMYDAPDLIERATGEKPNAQYFLNHLKNRYL